MKPLPMLATKAAPFDSEDYFFEVKWDGVRALSAPRLLGRTRTLLSCPKPGLDKQRPAVSCRFPKSTCMINY
jgi:hypothetical protein